MSALVTLRRFAAAALDPNGEMNPLRSLPCNTNEELPHRKDSVHWRGSDGRGVDWAGNCLEAAWVLG